MKRKYIDADRLREAIDAQRQRMVYALYEVRKGSKEEIRVKGMHDAFVDQLALIDSLQQEQPEAPVYGEVHHVLNCHYLATDDAQLCARLREFPEGAKVDIFIIAKEDEKP